MIQHPSHYLHCRPIIFILKGLHHLIVETEHFRYHGRINTKLASTCQVVQKILARAKDTEYTIPNLDKPELKIDPF